MYLGYHLFLCISSHRSIKKYQNIIEKEKVKHLFTPFNKKVSKYSRKGKDKTWRIISDVRDTYKYFSFKQSSFIRYLLVWKYKWLGLYLFTKEKRSLLKFVTKLDVQILNLKMIANKVQREERLQCSAWSG